MVLLIILIILKNTFFVPLFKQNLITNIMDEAQKVATHLSHSIDYENKSKEKLDLQMELVLKDFQIKKIHYFSKTGEVIYSTDSKKIGTCNKKDYFHKIVAKGNIYC